ncbi:MAG: cyclic nucleotide-binding domain-containing protein [Rhodospirillales bacterium]
MDWSHSFPRLTADDIEVMLSVSEKSEFMLGDTIAEEGQHLDHFFILESGRVGVERSLHGGIYAQFIKPLEKGDIFGEMSFIGGLGASATLLALTDVATISFPADKVKELIANDDGLAARLYQSFSIILVERLMRTNLRTETFDPRL